MTRNDFHTRVALTAEALKVCARAGMQTPAMFTLNKHVVGTRETMGVGYDAAARALVIAGLEAPRDPQTFLALEACKLLGLEVPTPRARETQVLDGNGNPTSWH